MNHTKEYIEISVLLYKQQSGTISEQEQVRLNDWKNQSDENLKLVAKLSSDLKIKEKQSQYKNINAAKAWEQIESKIVDQKPKTRRLFTDLMKYAAAIILPLAIGGLLVYQVMNTAEDYSESIVEQIQPGTNKATLVLADGSTVDLESQRDTLIEGKVLNKDNLLAYSNAEQLANTDAKWHKLIVPVGGEYDLLLSDGTRVWMNSDSELKYTDQFIGNKRIVHLKGEACFKVSKDSERPFIVKTSTMDVKVYGTEFNVMAYEDEVIVQTTLLEGSVGVDLKNESGIVQSSMLKPNMQIEYRKGYQAGDVKIVEASQYMGWRDGIFQFNNEELGSIMRKLERWYGVKFFTQNQEIQHIRFTGGMKRFDDFSTILNLLEFGSDVEFEVHNKNVVARSVN